ncbi:MAG: hypothetical protein FJ146_07660 [Deltaproteobacteria bacterium]|nr:hypothetical protein [Deltaproteobacteria bacterium]
MANAGWSHCHITPLLLTVFLVLFGQACRTTKGSKLDSWALDGSEDKAEQFIVATVYNHFPNLPEDRTVAKRFARGLMDKREVHAEESEYVLSVKSAQGAEALESYVVLEFASSTNVLELAGVPSDLKYLGPAPDQSDVE